MTLQGHVVSMLFCLPVPQDFCTVCCLTVTTVLISLYAVGVPYMKGATLKLLPCCLQKPDPALYNLPLSVLWPAGLKLAGTTEAPPPVSGTGISDLTRGHPGLLRLLWTGCSASLQVRLF